MFLLRDKLVFYIIKFCLRCWIKSLITTCTGMKFYLVSCEDGAISKISLELIEILSEDFYKDLYSFYMLFKEEIFMAKVEFLMNFLKDF